MYENSRMKTVNIYKIPIYIYIYIQILNLVYGPYIFIYFDLEACIQNTAYVYTSLNLGVQG